MTDQENPRHWRPGLSLVGMLAYGLVLGAVAGYFAGKRRGTYEVIDDANERMQSCHRDAFEAKARLDESRSMVGLCADALNACVRGHEEGDAP